MLGPFPGVIVVSAAESTRGFQSWCRSKGGSTEFIFDPAGERLVLFDRPMRVLENFVGSPHVQLARCIGADENLVLGGGITPSGEPLLVLTNENSGHYWARWNGETREHVRAFLAKLGFELQHDLGVV